MTAPPAAQTAHTSQPGYAPGGTATGYKMRILAHCLAEGIEITSSKAQRLAVRIARRAEAMQEQHDFYESLRVLGIYTDTTARDAVRNMEGCA